MRLVAKTEYLIVSKGMKFTGSGKLGLSIMHTGTRRPKHMDTLLVTVKIVHAIDAKSKLCMQ